MKTYKSINLIFALIFAASLLGIPAPASAQGPDPTIEANPYNNWVRVYNWPVGGLLLTLTINEGSPFYATAGQDPWNNNQTQAYFDLNGFDLKVGDNLKVTDGLTELTYTVDNLALTGFDLAAYTISGIGTPGVEVQVCLNLSNTCIWTYATPAPDGTWTASFSGIGDQDLVAGSNGQLFQPMQGNHTVVYWQLPAMEANPDRDWVIVYDWPVGRWLTLAINNGAPFVAPVGGLWDNSLTTRTYFSGFDLKAGDLIKVTDDSTPSNEITYTVSNLALTGFDLAADTISGIGTPGVDVQVCLGVLNGCIWSFVTPASDGTWTASFSGIGDLDPNSGGQLMQPKFHVNHTFVNWQIPKITAYPTRDWVQVLNWPVESELTLTINDTKTFTSVWPGNNDPKSIYFMDLGGFDLKAGDNIKVTDNATPPNEITYTVSNLALTGFDLAADTISGIGTPGVEVIVCGTSQENCIFGSVTTSSDGSWTYRFSGVGDQDLGNGGSGWLLQNTPGGATSSDWGTPMIVANLTGNWVQVNWLVESELTLTINDGSTFYATAAGQNPWNNSQTQAYFDLNGFDLKVGDNLKVTDNATPPNEVTYTTTNLSLTGFDLAADTITGTGAPGVEVGVCLNIPDNCIWNSATPDPDGNWTIKFTGVGDEDLVNGTNGEISQSNQGGMTLFDWEIPNIVTNRPPQLTNISAPNIPIQIGQSINATVTFIDPDINDTYTALWDWGDGLTSPGIVSEGNQSITGNHTYTTAGVYTINVTVTDAAGESDSATFEYVVVYDPTGGFVTGGGWIESPLGAYTPNPDMTGKATFGFVSKYQKGANVPTGNTEFQFKVANFNFSSTSYDWLVVAGAKAQYKGTGTINSLGNYAFMLAAIDGIPDRFRIKIWDKASGVVIYDNQLGAGDNAEPTTAIQGGSITVHKAK